MRNRVTFTRDDLPLVGALFTPEGFNEQGAYPAVIVQGSFTSVKEQMPAGYGQRLAEQGFVALAFDYAHYGESEGEPRQLESTLEKLADLEAAVTYLTEQPFITGVGMVGVCTSASNGTYLAADDPRLRAFATIAGMIASPSIYEQTIGAEGIARRIETGTAARRAFQEHAETTTLTVYSETDGTAVNLDPTPGAYDYYTDPERGNVPEYRNELDVSSWESWLTLNPLSQAPRVTVPTMIVHSDGCAFPDNAKQLYDAVRGEKELVWADGNHFDYYDSPIQMNHAVQNVARFFHAHVG